MRGAIAMLTAAVLVAAGCSGADRVARPYGASTARVGESLALLGWNISLSNLRWDSDRVLIDVDAAPSEPGKPHAAPADLRFGIYGTPAHPLEANGLGSCHDLAELGLHRLAAPAPDRLSGTVCLGPLPDHSAVRGVYVYSPRDRIANTAAAYPAAFPVGVLPTNPNDTGGLEVKTTSVEAFRADGLRLNQAALGDPKLFTGNGYMLLGLGISALAQRYRDESADRGGPMTVLVVPAAPGSDLNRGCAGYGSSVLVLPYAELDAVRVDVSLCTQGEINAAVLYATLSVVGTHAGVWTIRD